MAPVDPLTLIRDFGLPLGILITAIYGLLRVIRDILKGELMVPRYVYDAVVAENAELKAELRRAVRAAERAADVAEPAVDLAKRAVPR